MPRNDGTGPQGSGPMTGRGFGSCSDENTPTNRTGIGRFFGRGLGLGCRRGFGRGFGFGFNRSSSKSKKEFLDEQKSLLQDQLKAIDQELENL